MAPSGSISGEYKMISETRIMDADNLPPEMSARFDQPWNFVGEITGERRMFHMTSCGKCSNDTFHTRLPQQTLFTPIPLHIVEMRGYLFITDDMLEVMVYFGVCNNCDRVHWARQGPPFKRARCLAPTAT